MKNINDMRSWETEGHETSGAVEYLLYCVGGKWGDAPTEKQTNKMLSILNSEFIAEEGESLFWGAAGKVFSVVDGKWVSNL